MKRSLLLSSASIFLLALVIRVSFLSLLGAEQRIYDSLFDQYIYIDLGKNLVAGRGFMLSFDVFVAQANQPTSIQQPLYPLMIASLFRVFGENLLIIRAVQALISSATCVLIFIIAWRAFGKMTAILAGLMACVYAPLVMYVRPIMSETLYTFLLALIVFVLFDVATLRARLWHYLSLGALVALAFLVRPEVVLFAGPVILFFIGVSVMRRWVSVQQSIRALTLVVVAFFAITGPWAIRNLNTQGELLFTPAKRWFFWEQNWLPYMRETSPDWMSGRSCGNELECAIPNFADRSEIERDRYLSSLAMDFIRLHPGVFARYAVSRLLIAYPILPREELAPPLGYKGVRERPSDGYDITSLDDFPLYFRNAEKLRAWSFRLMLAGALIGVVIAMRRRQFLLALPLLPILFNVASVMLLGGKERFRLPIDPYLIVFAAYAVSLATRKVLTSVHYRPNMRAQVQEP
jgi:4-amino-4-deoxy-L-arabinose transferase-like glycosyltransferase